MVRILLLATLLCLASAKPRRVEKWASMKHEKAGAARAAALPKLVAAAEKAEADAKKLVSLALEADVAFEEGQMELKKTLAANMKAEQAKMRAQRLASTVHEMKSQGV